MKLAYVDTSCLVAIAFDEPGGRRLARGLERYDRLFASNLLEAEFLSARGKVPLSSGSAERTACERRRGV